MMDISLYVPAFLVVDITSDTSWQYVFKSREKHAATLCYIQRPSPLLQQIEVSRDVSAVRSFHLVTTSTSLYTEKYEYESLPRTCIHM